MTETNVPSTDDRCEAERMVEAARRSLSSVAEAMTEHAYQELASALESPPRIADKTAGFDPPGREYTAGDALGLRRVDELERGIAGLPLPPDVAEKVAEADRLRKLFEDAGEGQYNVLHLVESYQRNSMEADERLRAVRKLLEWNGCECECSHQWEDHDDDCDRCLACRIAEAIGK